MAREEEIRKQALKYGEPEYLLQTPNILGTQGFIQGAKWADSHPNLSEEEQVGFGGLGMMWQKKHLIDKACEWLSKTLYIHTESIEDKHWNKIETFDWVTSDYDSVSDFIDGFRKAMEE